MLDEEERQHASTKVQLSLQASYNQQLKAERVSLQSAVEVHTIACHFARVHQTLLNADEGGACDSCNSMHHCLVHAASKMLFMVP